MSACRVEGERSAAKTFKSVFASPRECSTFSVIARAKTLLHFRTIPIELLVFRHNVCQLRAKKLTREINSFISRALICPQIITKKGVLHERLPYSCLSKWSTPFYSTFRDNAQREN